MRSQLFLAIGLLAGLVVMSSTCAPERSNSEEIEARAQADGLASAARRLTEPSEIELALELVEQALKASAVHAEALSLKAELQRRKVERDAEVSGLLSAARALGERRETKYAAMEQIDRALVLSPTNAEARELRESIDSRYTGATYKPGETREVELGETGAIVIELAWIPPRVFMMGSPASEAERHEDEGPQHRVRISRGFWMMTTEVQQGQFEAVMRRNLSRFKNGPVYPVEWVSWYDAVEFANKLTEAVARRHPEMGLAPYYVIDVRDRDEQGRIKEAEVRIREGARGYRLPTEAEWEYACRAGTTGPFHFGASISTDQANYDGNYTYANGVKGEYRGRTTPAGFFGARGRNEWGLYDMHGNVWEWVWDWFGADFYQSGKWPVNGAGERVDPTGPRTGSARVLRGGSRLSYPGSLRSAKRLRDSPTNRSGNIGFRLSLDSE